MGETSDDNRKRNIIIVVVILIVIALAIGLGVGLSKKSGSCHPSVVFSQVNPSTVYNGIQNYVGLNISSLNSSATERVELIGKTKIMANWTVNSPGIVMSVPRGTPPDTYKVKVTNMAGCSATLSNFRVVQDITITSPISVTPSTVFTDFSSSFTANTNNAAFQQTPQVFLSPSNSSTSNNTYFVPDVIFNSNSSITVNLPSGVQPGTYDLVIINPDGSVGVLASGLFITTCSRYVLLFYITPSVLYSGIQNRIYVYVSGLNDTTTTGVELIGTNVTLNLTFSYPSNTSFGRLIATIPSSLAPGIYSVRVWSSIGCYAEYGPITVVSNLSLSIASISPSFVWTEVSTPVNILLSSPGFLQTPQVYLSPSGSAGATSYAIQAVLYGTPSSIDVTLPAGLPAGQYDVVIVNPDGNVAVKAAGVTVTTAQPPVISYAVPSSLSTSGGGAITLFGVNLANATGGTLSCGTPAVNANATTTTASPLSIQFAFPLGGITAGSLCSISVYFSTGQIYRYAAISVRAPNGNIANWQTQLAHLLVPRSAPSIITGAPLASTRVVYVAGGDNSTIGRPRINNTINSVEAATINVDGSLSNFSFMSTNLPRPCAYGAAVTISSYLYVLCGFDGMNNSASNLVYRTQVLNPLLVPTISSVDLSIDDSTPSMLTQGLWYYAVSAVFNASDPNNPGGESLPSPTLTIQLPNIPNMLASIDWVSQPGAVSYNVYRAPIANASSTNLQLIASVNTTSYLDNGAAPISTQMPLKPNSIGSWLTLPPLNVPRFNFASVAVALDTNKTQYIIFVFGGEDMNGNELSSYEFLQVTVNAPADGQSPETQNYSASWTLGTNGLSYGRSGIGALVVDSYDYPAIPSGQSWIYIGGGIGTAGLSNVMNAAQVTANGQLTFYSSASLQFQNAASGYCFGKANNFVFVTAGRASSPSTTGNSANYCTGTGGPCNVVPPDLQNFNSFGVNLNQARWYPSCVSSQVFIFVGGGTNGTAPLNSVERSYCCG
jgi:hypothetical protein